MNTEIFNIQEGHQPPEHRCSEGMAAETTKGFTIRVFNVPTSAGFQPHLVVLDTEDKDIVTWITIDFCPYCGIEVSNNVRQMATEKDKEQQPVPSEYMDYRRRFIQSGRAGKDVTPMSEKEWREVHDKWKQTQSMISVAREEHVGILQNDLRECLHKLCLSTDLSRSYPTPDDHTQGPPDSE